MICLIKLKKRDGVIVVYSGLFRSTAEAVLQATERFEFSSICVRAV